MLFSLLSTIAHVFITARIRIEMFAGSRFQIRLENLSRIQVRKKQNPDLGKAYADQKHWVLYFSRVSDVVCDST